MRGDDKGMGRGDIIRGGDVDELGWDGDRGGGEGRDIGVA